MTRMKSRSPRIYMRIRELRGFGRLHGGHVPVARLYADTYGPRYAMKSTLSTRRTSHSIQAWAPYV